MATYLERFALVRNAEFANRLQMALWIKAVDVLGDAGSTNEEKQSAGRVLRGLVDGDKMTSLAIICSANPTIGAAGLAATDSDIQFVVGQTFNRLSI